MCVGGWGGAEQEIASDVLAEQSPQRLLLVRGKLYELLVNCIPPEVIIRTCVAPRMPISPSTMRLRMFTYAGMPW